MQYLKKLGRCYLYIFIWLIILTMILSFFYYFNIISNNIVKIFKLLIPIILILASSYKLGKTSTKKGYISGLYLGTSFISILFVINILLFRNLNIRLFIYYLIIILVSILGGMIGRAKRVQAKA